MEFLVGSTYQNRKGEYEVLAVKGDELTVRYSDGTLDKLTKSTQERIIQNLSFGWVPDADGRNSSRFGELRDQMTDGLAPADIHIPDDDGLQILAEALKTGALHYYLENKEGGERQPHLYCRPDAWASLAGLLRGVRPESVTDPKASTSDHREPPWVLTRVRNCYGLLQAVARVDETNTKIRAYIQDLEAEWPVLRQDTTYALGRRPGC